MKKKLQVFLITSAAMAFGSMACHAAIIPAEGAGQIGYSAVVLCDSLSLHAAPAYDSQTVQTLKYADRVIVMDSEDGWAHCTTGDAEDSPKGYVNEDYLILDPEWYQTEGDTVVYAWNEIDAPKIALLDQATDLPVLRDDGDWIAVSLRGAAGWIHNPVRTDSSAASGTSQTDSGTLDAAGSSQADTSTAYDEEGADYGESGETAFTVYAEDGSTVVLHFIAGATYEDTDGRTYLRQDDDYYYCIPTDITYALFPDMWTGEIYGENEFPEDNEY